MDDGPSKYISNEEGLPNMKISTLLGEISCNFLHMKYLFGETGQLCHFQNTLARVLHCCKKANDDEITNKGILDYQK